MRKGILTAVVLVAAFAALMVFASSCAKTVPVPPKDAMKGEFDGAPKWVFDGCGAFWDKKEEKKICGVGSIGGTANASIARTTAVSRGRTEIARSLQTQVQAMVKDYQATTTGGQNFGTAASDEQHVEDVAKQITDLSLSGTEQVASWISPNGTFYALVVLDVAKFKDSVSKMQNLSEAVRQAVIQRADKAFDDLDKSVQQNRESKQ